MNLTLTDVEARVIGSLIEKELTTPDYYPMSLNALTNACNQKSNRDPVVSYEEAQVDKALEGLRGKKLAVKMAGSSGRVPKHRHLITEALKLSRPEMAVLCVLMLRGPQTLGEIRGRAARMYEFNDLAEEEDTLRALINREAGPLVTKPPRQPGRKEPRYAHLLTGPPDVADPQPAPAVPIPKGPEIRAGQATAGEERIAALEEQVQTLGEELAQLREQFDAFRKQFE